MSVINLKNLAIISLVFIIIGIICYKIPVLFVLYIIGLLGGMIAYYLNSVNYYEINEKRLAVGLLSFPIFVSFLMLNFQGLQINPLGVIAELAVFGGIMAVIIWVLVFIGVQVKKFITENIWYVDSDEEFRSIVFPLIYGGLITMVIFSAVISGSM